MDNCITYDAFLSALEENNRNETPIAYYEDDLPAIHGTLLA